MNLLNEIISHKRGEIIEKKKRVSLKELQVRAEARIKPPSFVESLLSAPLGLIAEVKRRSPSAGMIREPFDPEVIAKWYEKAGAQAVSVLMDEKYFGGGETDFRTVRAAVRLPLLYKEFVVDEWQIWDAAALGASAVLLIVAALDSPTLARLLEVCRLADVEPLVEVHTLEEALVAVALGIRCLGVNNRDLRTFRVSLDTTARVAQVLPASSLLISESGIKSADDVQKVKELGARAVLVGEHLLRQEKIVKAVHDLMSKVWL